MWAPNGFSSFSSSQSHYDDDGYVIQWFRSPIPSNSLASVYSLIDDDRRRKVLGDDVDIEIDVIDETDTVLRFDELFRRLKAADGAMVGLVGVQSNQFPRAVDIGRQFRDAGIQVIMGGFHAAGSIAMLPQCPPEIVAARELGISIYAGEAEGHMDEIVQAAWAGTLKPLYNLMKDLPDLSNATLPILPAKVVRKMAGACSPVLTQGGAARSNARSAPSSTCRAGSRAIAPLTMSRRSSAPMRRRTSTGSSSPTTISRATRTGKGFSTGSSGCARSRASNSR